MRIDFSKTVPAKDLGPYLSPTNPREVMEYGKKRHVVQMEYNLRGLEESLVDLLDTGLKRNNFETVRTRRDALWVSRPEQFTLGLGAQISGNYRGSTLKKNRYRKNSTKG